MNKERNKSRTYENQKADTDDSNALHGQVPNLMSAGTLMGNDVYNQEAEELGEIKEIMLDMRSGRIGYAVLSFGGFLSMGEKLFAVPWDALQLDAERKCFVLNVEKNRLENAPGFEKDEWPNMADPIWEKEIHTYYGTKPYAVGSAVGSRA